MLLVGLLFGPLFGPVFSCAKGTPPSRLDPPERAPAATQAMLASTEDATLQRLLLATLAQPTAWDRLARLCDDVGHRLSGSAGYEAAVLWALGELSKDGHKAWREPVSVPVWVRGEESLEMLAPRRASMDLLGLGGTVGTPGVEAEVVVVSALDELGPSAKGKIVLLNVPMAEGVPSAPNYGAAVRTRTRGPSLAAAQGAVGVLVRSITTRSLYTPHTGALGYDEAQPKIPAAAITHEDADQIARLVARGIPVRMRMALGAQTLPDAPSFNVLAEIRGATHPDEIVLIGAHLDSWDVGQGAHDDGAGVVHVIEAMRQIAALGEPPQRTIRAVLFANEENGLAGGKAYFAAHGTEHHVVAMESDLGGGRPQSWGATANPDAMRWLRENLAPLGLSVMEGGGGADISPLEGAGVPVIGLRPDDSHYFDIHHTRADTVDKVDPAALQEGVAAVAGLAWLLANAPPAPAAADATENMPVL